MISSNRMGRKKLDRERINVTLPKGMPAALDEAARERGWDRSRLLEELAADFLKKRERKAGSEQKADKDGGA